MLCVWLCMWCVPCCSVICVLTADLPSDSPPVVAKSNVFFQLSDSCQSLPTGQRCFQIGSGASRREDLHLISRFTTLSIPRSTVKKAQLSLNAPRATKGTHSFTPLPTEVKASRLSGGKCKSLSVVRQPVS